MRYVYPAVFHLAKDGISVEFPDLSGCLPCADNVEEALRNAKEAMQLHLYAMKKDGDKIPTPTPIENIKILKNERVMLIKS